MIVPMKKVSLIVLGDKKEQALKLLRKTGLVHIEITEGSGRRLTELRERAALLESSVYTVSEAAKKASEQLDLPPEDALGVAGLIASLSEEKKTVLAEESHTKAELEKHSSLGSFDPAELAGLAESGIHLELYSMPTSEYEKLGDGVKTVALRKSKNSVSFVLVRQSDEPHEDTSSIVQYRTELPRVSTSELRQTLAQLSSRLAEIDAELTKLSCYHVAMKDAVKLCEKEIEFELYSSGMASSLLSTAESRDVSVCYFTGYIEAEKLPFLRDTAKENAWGLAAEDPTEEDNVPTKLKNNRFVSLVYPLTDFMGTVPGYFEYDISGWFLGFILIFFGIIFGDGGYGLLITAVAAIPIIKALVTGQKQQSAFLLMGLFGLSTILWGTLTCTWFGLSTELLPQWLRSLSVPVLSNVYADKIWYPFWTAGEAGLTTAQNVQIFCFTLALVQLSAAHIMAAARNRHSPKMLGDIGSVLQLLGIYYVVLSLVVNSSVFGLGLVLGGIPVGALAIAFVGIGFVMSFVFSNYEGSLLKSVLSSLKNIVSVLLGVVNVFSDIVSYIRLWAVGLAGAAISATGNELAGPLLGNFLFMIIAIVLLVFGHGLNMILNILSVIVHGIRLNTLEFSSHLDMSWSGHKFKPFEE